MAVKRVIEGVHVVPMGMANAFLIEGDDGLTLIDAGYPGKEAAVFGAIRELGRSPNQLKHLIFTHGHPDHIGSVPLYDTIVKLHLTNTYFGLILPYVTLQLAISILIMRSMFQLVPHELIESAKIDGAGPLRTLWTIGLPMVRNGLVVIFIVNFVTAWGEYLLCLTLIDDRPYLLASAAALYFAAIETATHRGTTTGERPP